MELTGPSREFTPAPAYCVQASSWFETIEGEGPENPRWIRSHELDRDGSGYSTKLWFDRRSDTVRFWALNPYG
ncbi:hypothetical protein C6376_25195 [Streptomyces sp. P3]|uniref:hypothetical protein n=1 Tax=Streptomyces sp. P3 TaxID=2135430 RepID=UPI000D1BF442|nr:hypothetical protein [Streptomyces sp. P3]AVV44243.1 hypothetical protein C6376_25195 [Streptomyces sp. P3]